MESIERLQRRIETLDDLHTIVRTMKALSAVSIRQFERAAEALQDYSRTVEMGLHVVLKDLKSPPAPPERSGDTRRLAAVVFGSDHGLCGRFNEDIVTYALQRMDASAASSRDRQLLAVGFRVAASLEQAGLAVEKDLPVPGSAAHITTTVQQVLLKIDEWRNAGDIQYVAIYYNAHLSGNAYRPTSVELLPVDLHRFKKLQERNWPSRGLPAYTMTPRSLLADLLRQHFFISIFRACAESLASEHGARLNAMQSAEKNLDEKLGEMKSLFRSLRQEAITTELLDVVSGFEAATTGSYE